MITLSNASVSYMVSPDADPEEALVLYLIIFHLLTVTEICNAKIPSLGGARIQQANATAQKTSSICCYQFANRPGATLTET